MSELKERSDRFDYQLDLIVKHFFQAGSKDKPKGPKGRLYVLIQIADFAFEKSIIDLHTIRIRANREEAAPFQH